jgi:hypothetical protein
MNRKLIQYDNTLLLVKNDLINNIELEKTNVIRTIKGEVYDLYKPKKDIKKLGNILEKEEKVSYEDSDVKIVVDKETINKAKFIINNYKLLEEEIFHIDEDEKEIVLVLKTYFKVPTIDIRIKFKKDFLMQQEEKLKYLIDLLIRDCYIVMKKEIIRDLEEDKTINEFEKRKYIKQIEEKYEEFYETY